MASSHLVGHSSAQPYPFPNLQAAKACLDAPPPPSLRDILQSYKRGGDGDRDMLLAMLNAKTAEDQRVANTMALHRTMLELYQISSQTHPESTSHNHHGSFSSSELPSLTLNGRSTHERYYPSSHSSYHVDNYPTPSLSHSPPPAFRAHRSFKREHEYEHETESRRSVSHTSHPENSPYARDSLSPRTHYTGSLPQSTEHREHLRKRRRASPLSHPRHSTSSADERQQSLPLSPRSSRSSTSDPDYSPRAKASMAIGSLLQANRTRRSMSPQSDRDTPRTEC